MKFRATYQKTSNGAQSPVRVVEQMTGREVGWINRYLDREYVRRLADRSLRIYAHNLLHFVNRKHRNLPLDLVSPAYSNRYLPLSMCSRCSVAPCLTTTPANASIGSPID
jgi:hypothetical protein